jgi:acetoin utilization protein AcuC
VVGSSLTATDWIMQGLRRRAFVPIGGLHHAARDRAAGFCVFNDCGVVIEHLRRDLRLSRIAYVDIDAHHGDGVYLRLRRRSRADLCRPARERPVAVSGHRFRCRNRPRRRAGTKLNVPLPAGAGDASSTRCGRACWRTWSATRRHS